MNKSVKELIKLKPSILPKIWGGERLGKIHNLKPDAKIGETWEVSIHPEGRSHVDDIFLDQLVKFDQLPYLVKYIDTSDNLSVQVHPDDQYAKEHENSVGKTECWLILDSTPDAGIYLGIKDGVEKDEFEQAVRTGSDVSELLNFYPVSSGDFFFVPAGAVHAIGRGVFLCEIQQSSGITYRAWDWNRMGDDGKPRQLHIEHAMKVIRFEESFNTTSAFMVRKNIFEAAGVIDLLSHRDFNIRLYQLRDDACSMVEMSKQNRLVSFLCLDGVAEISCDNMLQRVSAFETVALIPHENMKVAIRGTGKVLVVR